VPWEEETAVMHVECVVDMSATIVSVHVLYREVPLHTPQNRRIDSVLRGTLLLAGVEAASAYKEQRRYTQPADPPSNHPYCTSVNPIDIQMPGEHKPFFPGILMMW
jgi:hypothetical protein